MSVFSTRPALRWLVPAAAAAVVIGGGAALGQIAAVAEPSLPERTAAQLLVDLQTARLDGLSGTVVQRSELGLPEMPAILKQVGAGAGTGPSLASLLSGSNTLRVWYNGPEQARIALVSTLGETDLIRNGRDAWIWNSQTNTAEHYRLPADDGEHSAPSVTDLPASPQEAAELALKAVEPTTEVTTGRNARVAGRDAYELILAPKDKASLVGQVRLAIDAVEHLPLRVEVFPKGSDEEAFEVAFTQISFDRPDAGRFRFNPPPGAKVTEKSAAAEGAAEKAAEKVQRATADKSAEKFRRDAEGAGGSAVVGEGWTSVFVTRIGDSVPEAPADSAGKADDGEPAIALLDQLPRVSGTWGSGRLLTGKLFSALLTDDGRVLAGAVPPERLYEVAGSAAAKVK